MTTSGHWEPRDTILQAACQNLGSGQGRPHCGAPGRGPSCPHPRGAECVLCPHSVLSGASASPGQQPHCADTGSQQLLGLRGRGYGLSPSPGSCSASQDGHPGGLAQLHPEAGLGGQGHSLQAAGRQSTGPPAVSASLPSPRPQLCPALFKAFRSCSAAFPGCTLAPTPHHQAGLGRQLGRPAREAGCFLLGPVLVAPMVPCMGETGSSLLCREESPAQAPRYPWKAAGSPGLPKSHIHHQRRGEV